MKSVCTLTWIGDAFYFLYGSFYPNWNNAIVQLLSFLADNLILLYSGGRDLASIHTTPTSFRFLNAPQSSDTMEDMKNRTPSLIGWRALTRQHPSAFLLAAQLLSLILYAALGENSSGRVLLGVVGILILALVVWVIDRSPALTWIGWVLVAPAIVLSLLYIFFDNPILLIWSSWLEAVLYFYAAGSMVAYMMKDYQVTTDELFAAGSAFTLIAWGFAYLYLICQMWLPDSFIGITNPGEPRTFLELLFLSFTNLTAAGLGDILPVTPPARVLVMLEQFAGIGYVAVVVSRLIGMTLVQQKNKERS